MPEQRNESSAAQGHGWDYEGRVIQTISGLEARVVELEGALAKAMRLVHFDMLDSREYHEIKEVINRGV